MTPVCHGRVGREVLRRVLLIHTAGTAVAHRIEDVIERIWIGSNRPYGVSSDQMVFSNWNNSGSDSINSARLNG